MTITPQPWESGETCRKVLFRETPLSQPLTTCLTRCPLGGASDFRLLTNTTPTTPHRCSATRHGLSNPHHSGPHTLTQAKSFFSFAPLSSTLQLLSNVCLSFLCTSLTVHISPVCYLFLPSTIYIIFLHSWCEATLQYMYTMTIKGHSILVLAHTGSCVCCGFGV